MKLTKTQKLLNALLRGEKLTLAQVSARYKLKDPAVAMSDLRLRNGYAITYEFSTDTKGRITKKWFLGTPPNKVVALGYRALLEMSRKA
jgi:hypothetical protein